MLPLEFHPDVYQELSDSYIWYESKATGLGEDFLNELDTAFSLIQRLPEIWPKMKKEYRRYLLKRFPFGIIYKIQPTSIYVGAVMHLSRNPGYWKNRMS